MLHSAHLQLQAIFGVEPTHSRDAAGAFHHSFGDRMLRAMCCTIARVALFFWANDDLGKLLNGLHAPLSNVAVAKMGLK